MRTSNQLYRFGVLSISAFAWFTLTVHADEEADRVTLRNIKSAYEEALNSDNVNKLAALLDPNFSGVVVTGEEIKGLEGLQRYWGKIKELIGPGGTYHVKVNAERADTEFLGDVAVSHGTTDETVRTDKGRNFEFNSLWTAVCRKQNGEWKVVRIHAAMNPVNNAFTSTFMRVAKLAYGGGGLGIGFLLGFLTRFIRRS
jgi:ketosteroid isomerase-like protein